MNLTQTFAFLFVAALVATILASAIPGAWWQWAAVSAVLALAALSSAGFDYRNKEENDEADFE